MTTDSPQELLEDRRGPVLWLTITREERRNAMSHGVLAAMAQAITAAQTNRSVRAIVITGAGTSRSIASATVQRPSPESTTYGAMPSIVGFLPSASVVSSSSHERTTLP